MILDAILFSHWTPPRSAEELRALRRRLEDAKRRRDAERRAHDERLADLVRETTRSTARAAKRHLDADAIYAARRASTITPAAKTGIVTVPPRARTFAQLAASYYAGTLEQRDELIPTSARGSAGTGR